MRQFRFRLQTLLEVRIQREEQAQQELGRARRALALLEDERRALCNAIEEQKRCLVFDPRKCLEIDSVRQDRFCLDRLERRRNEMDKQIDRCAREVERCRQALVDRSREREMVEKLKQRDKTLWQKEMARLDQVQLDEVSSIAFNRRRRQAGEVRTWILLAIMLALLIALIYLMGTVSGRQWMDRVQKGLLSFESFGSKKTTGRVVGIAGEGPGSATGEMNIEDQPREVITVESVRMEKNRLEKWDLELQQKEQRVQLELIAMAEMRDRIAALQQEVERQKQELEKQRQAMEAEAVREREERLDKLAKLYTDSKPKVAAQLLLDRDLESTVEILQRMNERDLIKIVEEMNKMEGTNGPGRAKEILELFAEKALEKKQVP